MKEKKRIQTKPKGYNQVLNDIRFLLDKAKAQAYKAVDNIRVQTYWQIGERIAREELKFRSRAEYGKTIVEKLAKDIHLSQAVIWRLLQFYKIYPILVTVSRELSWSHYEVLITISKNKIRQFYEQQTILNRWSVRTLREEIKVNLYQRAKKQKQIVVTTSIAKVTNPGEIFKNTYDFRFLDLKPDYKERHLKYELLNKLEKFLQELGSNFFIGRRESPVLIAGNYDKVDLELFHSGLLCYILVDIKTEKFKHSHVSQMYSYLNWYKEHKWQQGQRHPVGLIICKTKEEETVHYALGDLKKEIFVAEYKTKLPSEEEIKSKLTKLKKQK